MDCNAFEERWMEALDGDKERGEGAVPEALTSHLAGCRRCRELVATAGAIEPPADLLGSILARTSGSPCDRAGRLLAERLDSRPGELDPLLRAHLDRCGRCGRLAPVLATMGPDLACLAELEPDPDFVADVMAATVSVAPPRAWDRFGVFVAAARESVSWKRLLARPRLALEGAFLAAVAVVLLLGIPSESVSDVPAHVLARAREERAEVTEELREFTSANVQWLGKVAEDRWERFRPRLDRWLDIAEGSAGTATEPGSGTGSGAGSGAGERSAWARWSGELLRVVDRIRDWLEALLADGGVASRGAPGATRGEIA